MQGFETVRRELEAKRHQLEQELDSVQGKVAELRADLERVHEALDALVGGKKKSKGRSRSQKKPAPTIHEIQGLIARVRGAKPFASAKELQKEVRDLVRESGGSVAGFPRRFAEALASSPGFTASAEVTQALASAARAEPFPHEEPEQVFEEQQEHSHDHGEQTRLENPQGELENEGPFAA